MIQSQTDALASPSEPHAATKDAPTNSIRALQTLGQSVWLDYLRRSLFTSGEFKRLIAEDGLRGATSNPSIFEKAIAGSTDYLGAIQAIQRQGDMEPMVLYEALAIRDIRDAADLLRPVYDSTTRADGYVSMEVSPYLAHDTAATIEEARRLWKAVARENVMIKIPASIEGLPAIRQLTSEGINVNITLLFGIERYEAVARAYMEGLSTFVRNGGEPAQVCSVASFFVSRIDTMVDGMITTRLATATDPGLRTSLTDLLGTVAIANAKIAYQRYLALCRTLEWQQLASKGAHPQRLLWASTSTKNPRYRDVRYVEELIGRDTVNTITPATIEAFRDHGRPRASLEEGIDDARATLAALERVGISLNDVTDRLLEDGVTLFCKAFDNLLAAVDHGRRTEITSVLDRKSRSGSRVIPDLRVCANLADLSRRAADAAADTIIDAVRTSGTCSIALSGGSTPRTLYGLLASQFRDQIPWAHVHVFWGDERYVPPEDPRSNYRMAKETLLDRVPCPPANVHPMPTHFPKAEVAAREYERTLRNHFVGEWPDFDLVLLGMGDDGHTASLFPGSLALAERARWVVAAQAPVEPQSRLTLTLPVLSRAAAVHVLVAGATKREALRHVLEGAGDWIKYPAAGVRCGKGSVIWWADSDAAAWAEDRGDSR